MGPGGAIAKFIIDGGGSETGSPSSSAAAGSPEADTIWGEPRPRAEGGAILMLTPHSVSCPDHDEEEVVEEEVEEAAEEADAEEEEAEVVVMEVMEEEEDAMVEVEAEEEAAEEEVMQEEKEAAVVEVEAAAAEEEQEAEVVEEEMVQVVEVEEKAAAEGVEEEEVVTAAASYSAFRFPSNFSSDVYSGVRDGDDTHAKEAVEAVKKEVVEKAVARHAPVLAALRVLCLCMCAVLLSGDVMAAVVWGLTQRCYYY